MGFLDSLFGGGDQEVTTTNEPPSYLRQPLSNLAGLTDNALNNLQPYYPFQTYANLTPLQEAGQYGALDYAQNYFQPATFGFQNTLGRYMDAPLNISQDPAVQAMMAANEQSVGRMLTESALPAIRTNAINAGGLGGSRQKLINEPLAVGRAADSLANANAQTMLGAYGTASGLAGQAAGMFPGALNLGFTPSNLAQNIGGQYQGIVNQGINEAMTRYGYPEQNLWNRLANASNIYTGAGAGYGNQTQTQPGENPLSNILGLGMTGYGIYAGMTGGASAALPWLAMASDRRLKTNVAPLGNRGTPYQWYEFEYLDPSEGAGVNIGVMADEVENINPAAIMIRDDGYKMVNYGAL